MPNQRDVTPVLRLNLALTFVEGLLILGAYLKEPSEASSAVLLGFSPLRLSLIGLVLCSLSATAVLLIGSLKRWPPAAAVEKSLMWAAEQKGVFRISLLGLPVLYILLFLSERQLGVLAAYRERLLPILLWLAALILQFVVSTIYLRGIQTGAVRAQRGLLIPALIVLAFFAGLLLLIKFTHLGLTPDRVYWQGAGVPILLYQVLFAALAAALFAWLITRLPLGSMARRDAVVFLTLWGLACLVWLNQSTRPTYFSLGPGEPNFQMYPFSDALIYDSTAQEFLIGKPMPADFWIKPLYSLFLAVLHLLSGHNYALLASLQVTVLAVIPGFIYLLTACLHQRLAGLLAAFLIIIRERNAMALSNVIQTSHSKLLLSDVFAMAEMVILVWLVVWWLRQPAERRAAPIAVGGMLGLLILTRGHPVLMIPFVFLIGFIVLTPNLKLWWESSWRIAVGLALVLLPWFWHTYQSTGRFSFQDPSSPYAVNDTLVKLYTQPAAESVPGNPASYEEFQSQAFRSLLEQPGQVAYFTATHYFHNLIFSYLFLPGSFQIEDLSTYVRRLPFWNGWEGGVPKEPLILMLLNFVILSLGISAAWKKARRLMLAPFILGAAYNLSIAVARRSGWRFILPADWISLVFYAIGLIQLMVILRSVVSPGMEPSDRSEVSRQQSLVPRRQPLLISGLPFLLIAMGLIFGNRLFPLRYPARSPGELWQDYERSVRAAPGPELAAWEHLVENEGAVLLQGRALYPIYLNANEGMVNFNWASFSPLAYPRLAFYLIGAQSISVNLPVESPPASFPDGADVLVIGCWSEAGDINALAVLIQGASPIQYVSASRSTPACSLPAP